MSRTWRELPTVANGVGAWAAIYEATRELRAAFEQHEAEHAVGIHVSETIDGTRILVAGHPPKRDQWRDAAVRASKAIASHLTYPGTTNELTEAKDAIDALEKATKEPKDEDETKQGKIEMHDNTEVTIPAEESRLRLLLARSKEEGECLWRQNTWLRQERDENLARVEKAEGMCERLATTGGKHGEEEARLRGRLALAEAVCAEALPYVMPTSVRYKLEDWRKAKEA